MVKFKQLIKCLLFHVKFRCIEREKKVTYAIGKEGRGRNDFPFPTIHLHSGEEYIYCPLVWHANFPPFGICDFSRMQGEKQTGKGRSEMQPRSMVFA